VLLRGGTRHTDWVSEVFKGELANKQQVPLFPTMTVEFISKANMVKHIEIGATSLGKPTLVGRPRLQERHRSPSRPLRGGSKPNTVTSEALLHIQGHLKVPGKVNGTFQQASQKKQHWVQP
jgi:hypothetical protein